MTPAQFYFHPAAIKEAEAAARWYRERSSSAAARFVDELSQAIDMILEAPRRWPHGEHGTRKVKLPCYPFSVIYRELRGAVMVLPIVHGRRRPGYWKRRL